MAKSDRPNKPSRDPVIREQQLAALAYDLAEKQLIAGTASPSVITHFLKISTEREKLEQDILKENKILISAKAESITKNKDDENIAKQAIDAMTKYRSSDK